MNGWGSVYEYLVSFGVRQYIFGIIWSETVSKMVLTSIFNGIGN